MKERTGEAGENGIVIENVQVNRIIEEEESVEGEVEEIEDDESGEGEWK